MAKRDKLAQTLTARSTGRKRRSKKGGAVTISMTPQGRTSTSTPDYSGGSKRSNKALGGPERPKMSPAAKKLTRRK